MTFRATTPNFSKGELAPQLYGRFDTDAFASAVKKARNVIVLKYGGLTKRPGTRIVGEVLEDSSDNRLIPFQFSLEQTYAIELGQGYMAPCALGGRVIETELAITGVTNAPEAVVEAAYHGYAVGNFLALSGIAGAIGDLLNGRVWQVVAVPDDNHFAINANTVGLAAFTTATGGITRTGAPDPEPVAPTVPDPVEPALPPDIFGWWKFGGFY